MGLDSGYRGCNVINMAYFILHLKTFSGTIGEDICKKQPFK